MRISKGVIKTVDVEFLGCVGLSRICTGSTGSRKFFDTASVEMLEDSVRVNDE